MSLEKLAAAKEFDIEVYSRQADLPDKSDSSPGDRAFVIEDKEFFVFYDGDSAPGNKTSDGWYAAQAVNRSLTEINEDLTELEKRANPDADLPNNESFQGHDNEAHKPDFVKVDDFDEHNNNVHSETYATEAYADTAYEDDDAVEAANNALNQHSSLSTLSDAVAGKPDSKMTDSEAVSAVNSQLPEHGNVTDLSNEVNTHESLISGKADDNHGNGAHSDDFATESWVSTYYADDYHDNSAHSETFATEDWVNDNFNNNYYNDYDAVSAVEDELNWYHDSISDLSSSVRDKASDNHNNNAHSETYATTNWVSNNYADQSDLNNIDTGASDNHGNGAHSKSFATQNWVENNIVPGDGSGWAYPLTGADNDHGRWIDASAAGNGLRRWGGDSIHMWPSGINSGGELFVKGNIRADGDLKAGGSKPFVIPHPVKSETTLRHSAYEGPVSGGLIYRDRIKVENGTETPDFPEYILNDEFGEDFVTSVTPVSHFGSGYLDTDDWTLHTDQDGVYDVIVYGMRDDTGGISGGGIIQEKPEDMTDTTAANKLYGGGNTAVEPIETATDVDIERIGLLQHAIEQSSPDDQQPEDKTQAEIVEERRRKNN